MYEFAFLLKSATLIESLYYSIKDLCNNSCHLKGKEIVKPLLSVADSIDLNSVLYLLMQNDVITMVKSGPSFQDYVYKVIPEKLDDFFKSEISAASVVSEYLLQNPVHNETNVHIVSTLPENIPTIVNRDNQIEQALIRLIGYAKKNIWIINPFFDDYGVAKLIPSLIRAAEDGAQIRILGREIYNPKNQSMQVAIQRIVQEFTKSGVASNLEYRDFYLKNDGEKQKYALHTKMLISDQTVYIGSANLTLNSLRTNFELGVIINGQPAVEAITLVELIWKNAIKINLDPME